MSNGEGISQTAAATEPAAFRIEVPDEQLTDPATASGQHPLA